MPNRVAILVLSNATRPYDEAIDAIRRTWGAVPAPGVDIYYVYGRPPHEEARRDLSRYVGGEPPTVEDDAICQIGDVLIAGCADRMREQSDCLVRKRLIAFAHLAAGDRYDLIHSVCAASYVDQRELLRFTDTLTPMRLMAGVVGINAARTAPYVSGASTIFSVDIARRLGADRKEILEGNLFGHLDDVTIGHWVATQMSPIPLATLLEDIERRRPLSADHIFVAHGRGSVSFVKTRQEDQRPVPGAFHYHFRSRGTADMIPFHQRYFA